MVWPNRGAIGAIGGYGLNVLNLLQGSHRCCRYAPAAASRRLARQSGKPKRHRPYSLSRPRAGPSSCLLPPLRTDGARDARGPKGPTGLDASRHRGLSSSFVGRRQVRQTQGVPRAVFEACSAPSPVVAVQSRIPMNPYVLPTVEAGHSAGVTLTGPPAYRPSEASACGSARRVTRGWTAGQAPHLRRLPFPGHRSPPRVWRR